MDCIQFLRNISALTLTEVQANRQLAGAKPRKFKQAGILLHHSVYECRRILAKYYTTRVSIFQYQIEICWLYHQLYQTAIYLSSGEKNKIRTCLVACACTQVRRSNLTSLFTAWLFQRFLLSILEARIYSVTRHLDSYILLQSIWRVPPACGPLLQLATAQACQARHVLTKFRVRTGGAQGNQMHTRNGWCP